MGILSTLIRAFALAGALATTGLAAAVPAGAHPSFGGMYGGTHAFHGFGGIHGLHSWGGHMGGWGHGGWGHGGWGNHNWNRNVNRNINRNVNINRNINRNVNVNRNWGHGHWGHGHWGHGHGQHGFHRWRDGFGRWHWAEAIEDFGLPFGDYGYGGGGYAEDNYSGDYNDDAAPYANAYDSGGDEYSNGEEYGMDRGNGCPCRCDRDNTYGDGDGGCGD